MSFPVYLQIGPVALHPHWVFESLAYTLAYLWFRRQRLAHGDVVDARTRWWVIGAAAVGGIVGSRLLYLIENPFELAARWSDPAFAFGGKTIVGGLAGGTIAVEWIKRRLGVVVATGDLLVVPLILGIAIGRIGCFLSGLGDRTYGGPTSLAWGVDFGDGVLRHPTQVYEIAFLGGLLVLFAAIGDRLRVTGDRFKLFIVSYMTFRLALDFLKPAVHVGGLSIIQWACVAVLAYYAPHVPRFVSEVRHG
jgi:phosphatidylglycerol:prolipoprotein diacylglycerol transferase